MNDFDFVAWWPSWIIIVVAIVVHIAFGIVSGGVALGKGRSFDLGFLAGFLLNVFGLIIVMLMRPSIEAEAQRRIEVEREYERQQRSGSDPVAHATDAEQRHERQRRPGPDPAAHTTDAEGYRRATISVRRARYEDVIDLRVMVLSTPDQRARGLNILASEAITGVLYLWPEEGTHKVNFLNPYSRIEMRVVVVDAEDRIQEFLTLATGDNSVIEPTSPVGSAIAFRAWRFEGLDIDIGDEVVLPDELRSLIWDPE